MEHVKPVQVRVIYDSGHGISDVKFTFIGVQEVRWDKKGTLKAGD